MRSDIAQLWVYLEATPLLWLTLTLVVFQAANALYRRAKLFTLLNPVLISVVVIVLILVATHTPYERYFDGAQFVHFLLGPATVALAIPLYRNLGLVRRSAVPIALALTAGSLTSSLGGYWIAAALGASPTVLHSLAPKSVTAPVAMAITQRLGGEPALTAALVILTGITGAVVATTVFRFARIEGWPARGLATGTASHGIGTARMLSLDLTAGAFSSLAMGLNAVLTSVFVPLIVPLLAR